MRIHRRRNYRIRRQIMAKILSIDNSVISIGTEGGGIKEVRACDLNFVPHVGDEVEIFETETKTIVSKIEPKVEPSIPAGGININLTNSQNNAQPAAVVAPAGTKAVSKVTYCVLAFLLGGIGIHKFYAGKTGAGIAYILFSWTFIPSIIAFFEGIVGLTKQADAAGNIIV